MTNTSSKVKNNMFEPYKYPIRIPSPIPKTINLLLSELPSKEDIEYIHKRVHNILNGKDNEEIIRCIKDAYITALTELDITVFPDLREMF